MNSSELPVGDESASDFSDDLGPSENEVRGMNPSQRREYINKKYQKLAIERARGEGRLILPDIFDGSPDERKKTDATLPSSGMPHDIAPESSQTPSSTNGPRIIPDYVLEHFRKRIDRKNETPEQRKARMDAIRERAGQYFMQNPGALEEQQTPLRHYPVPDFPKASTDAINRFFAEDDEPNEEDGDSRIVMPPPDTPPAPF